MKRFRTVALFFHILRLSNANVVSVEVLDTKPDHLNCMYILG